MPPNNQKVREYREREMRVALREEWYGKKLGRLESNFHDQVKDFSALASEFLTKNIPTQQKEFFDLGSKWSEIVGEDMASILKFADFEDGILYLEIRHPAFLQEELALSSDMIIEQVNKNLGKELCKSIDFLPYGKRR